MPNQLGQLQDRGTTKAFQVRFSVAPDYTLNLMPELAPVVPMAMPELDFHQGWRKYMVSGTIAALAANNATVQLRMPRTANIMCLIEGFWIGVANAEVVVSGIVSVTDLTTLLGAQVRDVRQVPTKPGICVASSQAIGVVGTGGGGIYSVQSQVLPPIFPLILTPSRIAGVDLDGFSFQATTVNQAYDFCLVYRERFLQEQENTP